LNFWLVVLAFVVAQNAQVALHGVVFKRVGMDGPATERLASAFKEPLFIASLLLLSIATAAGRLLLFPEAGVARTHVVTSAAVVLSFAAFAALFNEGQDWSRYVGVTLCAIGILLVAR
jgi:uncharacterized membrane protein